MIKRQKYALILIAILCFAELFSFVGGLDFIRSKIFQPTKGISEITENLELTDNGKKVFFATTPLLHNRELFNQKCNSNDPDIYIFGCYIVYDDKIHLFDIESEEVSEIKNVTAAHELLHAFYHRLPFWERNDVNEKLKKFYNNLPENDVFRKSMSVYDEKNFNDELHSKIGTEIMELSPELEKHYSRIFRNRKNIVKKYEKYSKRLVDMREELEQINAKIKDLKKAIDDKSSKLEQESESLNKRVEEYKNQKDHLSEEQQRVEVEKLDHAVDAQKAEYEAINVIIKEHNFLVEKYNNSAIRTNNILNSINSNKIK